MEKRQPFHADDTDEYRRRCLARERGACTEPICHRCGTIEQALLLAGWVKQNWPHCARMIRPLS
jgi:hypothetical protein